MKITVAGIGYVGLANACLLALRHCVTVYDISTDKIQSILNKKSPIADDCIEDFISNQKVSLLATTDKIVAFQNADFILISTPTNFDEKSDSFDTSTVEAVLSDIQRISPKSAVVIKSTVPVGFTERMRLRFPLLEIFFSPEFLREGKALYDNLYPSRIIVGGSTDTARRFADLLRECAVKKDSPVLFMKSAEAEAVKLFANTYLAMRVSFFNELDSFAELGGFDTKSIIAGVCLDSRIGDYYNNPSFGYGGYCLPKDTRQLKSNYKNIPENLISAVIASNKTRIKHIVDMIVSKKPFCVGVYRLIMKTGNDNIRSSSIVEVLRGIQEYGIKTVVYEPLLHGETFYTAAIIPDLEVFKRISGIIICNRFTKELSDVSSKVYTRDIFGRD